MSLFTGYYLIVIIGKGSARVHMSLLNVPVDTVSSFSSAVRLGADIYDHGMPFFSVIHLSNQLSTAEWFTGDIVVEAVHVFHLLLSSTSPSFNFPTQHFFLDPILLGDMSLNFICLSL